MSEQIVFQKHALPYETLSEIFQYLLRSDLFRMIVVCKDFYRIIHIEEWSHIQIKCATKPHAIFFMKNYNFVSYDFSHLNISDADILEWTCHKTNVRKTLNICGQQKITNKMIKTLDNCTITYGAEAEPWHAQHCLECQSQFIEEMSISAIRLKCCYDCLNEFWICGCCGKSLNDDEIHRQKSFGAFIQMCNDCEMTMAKEFEYCDECQSFLTKENNCPQCHYSCVKCLTCSHEFDFNGRPPHSNYCPECQQNYILQFRT